MSVLYYLFIRVTYPIVRVTHPDKEVKRFHWEAPLFEAPPAVSLRKFTLPVKMAAFIKAAFTGQPAGGGWAQGLIDRPRLYLIILFLFFPPHLAFFVITTRK